MNNPYAHTPTVISTSYASDDSVAIPTEVLSLMKQEIEHLVFQSLRVRYSIKHEDITATFNSIRMSETRLQPMSESQLLIYLYDKTIKRFSSHVINEVLLSRTRSNYSDWVKITNLQPDIKSYDIINLNPETRMAMNTSMRY